MLGPSGYTQTVSLDEITSWHDQETVSYLVRSSPSAAPISEPADDPLSIRALLAHLDTPLDPSELTQVYLDHPVRVHTETTALTPADLGESGANGFSNGLMPSVFLYNGDQISYARPLRADDPNDVNGEVDYWYGEPGQAINLYVQTVGHLLSPTILATPSSVAVGASTHLAVKLAGSPDTTGWTFAWDLGDSTSALATPTKTWTTAGTLPVSVTIDAPDGSHGYAQTTVKVTGPPTHKPPPTTGGGSGGNSNPHAPSTGPDHGTGSSTQQSTGTPGSTGDPTLPATAPPTVPGALSATPVPDVGTATGLATVVGTVLVNADGSVPASAAGGATSTPTLHPAGAHNGKGDSDLHWLWWLLLPALLLAGAAGELRPWSRPARVTRRKRHA